MQLSLISQILAENDYVQQVVVGQGPSPLVASYRRIKKLTKQLKHYSPTKKNYCLACTILSISAKEEIDRLRHYYNQSGWDNLSSTKYILSFERLQYQINLASSMLS